MIRKLRPITPGVILLMEFLKPLEISQRRLARDLNVPVRRVNDIVRGQRAITPDTALRLAVYFNMTPEFWMNLQSHYDLKLAKQICFPKLNAVFGRRRRRPHNTVVHSEEIVSRD